MVLSKDQILNAPDIVYETIDVPEWGGKVKIKSLTGDERDGWEQSIIDMRGNVAAAKLAGAQARLVALTVVDDDGKCLFDKGDVKRLGEKSALSLARVFEASKRLSRLTDEDVNTVLGNSDSVQSESSTTDSPSL
jgi:hypothetical protein